MSTVSRFRQPFRDALKLPCNPRVVIIGGGIAGIAAATALLEQGFEDVKILEAENRLGGRIHTVPFGTSKVDLGAHWVHGEEGNVAYEIGNHFNLITPSGDFASVQFVCDDGQEVPTEIGMELYGKSMEILQDKEEMSNSNESLKDYLSSRFVEQARNEIPNSKLFNSYLNWLIKFECTIEGCDDLSDPSVRGLTHFKQCPGDSINCWIEGGYTNIVDIFLVRIDLIPTTIYPQNNHHCAITQINPLEGKVFLNCEVTQIDWSGLRGFIKCNGGQTFEADHIIVTVSLGVLKEKHSTLFTPPLPDKKISAIRGLGIGTVNKIYLRFEKQWWPEGCSGFSLLRIDDESPLEDGETQWERNLIGFYTESSNPLLLGGWLVGEAARDMETFSDEDVLAGCYRTLRKFLGNKFDVPLPIELLRSNWFSNSHFRGSYSHRTMTTEVLETSASELAEPLKNFYGKQMLFFAGEATHSYFYSTVHGALETGWREAERLTSAYSKSPMSSL